VELNQCRPVQFSLPCLETLHRLCMGNARRTLSCYLSVSQKLRLELHKKIAQCNNFQRALPATFLLQQSLRKAELAQRLRQRKNGRFTTGPFLTCKLLSQFCWETQWINRCPVKRTPILIRPSFGLFACITRLQNVCFFTVSDANPFGFNRLISMNPRFC